MKKQLFSIFVVLFLTFSVLPVFFSDAILKEYSPVNYLIQQLLIFLSIYFFKDKYIYILSPTFLSISYLNINFIFGSWSFLNEIVYNPAFLEAFRTWKHFKGTILFFNIGNFLVFMSFIVAQRLRIFPKFKQVLKNIKLSNRNKTFILILSVLIFCSFLLVNFEISYFGVEGNFGITFRTVGAIIIFTILSQRKNKSRFIWYGIILAVFIATSSHNKREAVFLILPLFLLELYNKKFSIGFKQIVGLTLLSFFFLYGIMVMSIVRGYGNYPVKNALEATSYVDDYMKSKSFLESLFNNLEFSYTYFCSTQSVEYIYDDPSHLTYGETLTKFIFLPVPRSIFPYKPNSALHYFTEAYAPGSRTDPSKKWESFPISFYSEMFWNFHLIGLIALFIFYILFNKVYHSLVFKVIDQTIINHVAMLYAYMLFLFLLRGAGFDLYFLYLGFGYIAFTLYKIVIGTLLPSNRLK